MNWVGGVIKNPRFFTAGCGILKTHAVHTLAQSRFKLPQQGSIALLLSCFLGSHDFIGEFATSYRELSRAQNQFTVYEVSFLLAKYRFS